MAACKVVRLVTACLCFILTVVDCRNFDARFSVIKQGKERSYFGFSVAQHQYKDNDDTHNLLFIGAPKEERRVGNKVAGGSLYKCDAGTSDATDCELITAADPSTPYKDSELVIDQWLGVTVASAGPDKKVVACAHRYIKDNAATGFCTVLEPELDYGAGFDFMSCTKHPYKNFMKNFGLCQQGMSAAVGKDDALLMGAPGSVFWQGTVFAVNITDAPGFFSTEKTSPFKAEPEEDEQKTPFGAYSYNGYAVAIGKFDRTKKLYYVSGAPKSNNKGEVIFFTATSGSTLRYQEPHIIEGKLEFSGYGSSLLAVDLNNDGFDDLVVGAPFYYKRYHGGAIYVYLGGPDMITKETPVTEILSREMGEKECKQLQCEHARFGTSLTALGDINKDGFNDFAVGAPYEGNGAVYIYHGSDAKEGFNTKYVQRITAEDLPVPGLSSFGYSLSGGMDLDKSGYPDLLVGAYESNAVALIRARPIIKLKPSFTVSPTDVDLESKDGCNNDKVPLDQRDRLCVAIKLCLTYTSSIPVTPHVTYTLEAEPQRRFARVELVGATDENKRIITNPDMKLQPTGETCYTEVALMKSLSQFEDKLNPMNFKFSFGLRSDLTSPETYPGSAVEDINSFPYLDTDGSDPNQINSKTAQVGFVMECGDDNKCLSNLQFNAELVNLTRNEGTYELIISSANILYIDMTVWNEDEPAYLTKVYIETPANMDYLGTDSDDQVTCQRSLVNETTIECDQIGNPLRKGKSVNFMVRLSVPKDFAENPDLTHHITVWVNTSSTEQTPINDMYMLDFRVINKAEVSLGTNVAPDSAILCQGEPRGASSMKDETEIGAAVTHNYIITNKGPGVVSESYISIKWPYEVAGKDGGAGKHLLYLMRMPKIEGSVVKCNDDEIRKFVNPLKIKEVSAPAPATGASTNAEYTVVGGDSEVAVAGDSKSSRQRRDVGERNKRASGRVVTMSCQDDSARCFEYKCKLGKLESKNDYVKISLEARLWESTLLSDYRKTSAVEIISWGQLVLPEKLKIVQDLSNDRRRAITRAIPDFQESAGGKIQWWIILVAVLVGLLVLLVLIFILYKLGFFRRKRMEDMQMYKAEKKQQAMLQDYNGDGV